MLINFKSVRGKVESENDSTLISDLDALIQEPITFRLFGKLHRIKPITTAEFFKVTNALNRIGELQGKDKIGNEELTDLYLGIFQAVCDTIGKPEILQMTHSQILALFDLVMKTITGRIHAEVEDLKKKRSLNQSRESNTVPGA